LWFLGMARRAASDAKGAFTAFERAYAANPAHPDVCREFGGQCLALGLGDQAVVVCERTCRLHPKDAGLRANLALACMVADDMPRAKVEVTRALEMDPTDKVSLTLAAMIDSVIAGKQPRMTKYP
jgi:Flp pilus assembly protein TadD